MKIAARISAFILGAVLAGSAMAASTVNPSIPAPNSPLASAPIRQNFQATANDINNILGQFAGPTAPQSPSVNQQWMDNSQAPWVQNIWDGSQWVPQAQLNANTHQWIVPNQSYLPTASISALQAYGNNSPKIMHANVQAYTAGGTTGGGLFDYQSTCSGTPDNGVYISVTVTGSPSACWARNLSNATGVSVTWYGISTSGGASTTNVTRLIAASNAAVSLGLPLVGYNYGAPVPLNSETDLHAGVSFFGNGMQLSCADASGSFPNGACVSVSGTATPLGALSGDVAKSATSFTLVSTPTLAIGDIVFLVDKASGSYNAARTYYYAGEAAFVTGVSGNTVTVGQPLRFAYPSATTKVTKITPTNGELRDFAVSGQGLTSLVSAFVVNFGGPSLKVVNVAANFTQNAAIAVNYSVGTTLDHVYANEMGATSVGQNYGVAIVNSSGVTVSHGTAFGTRHGTTVGGGDTDYAITNFSIKIDHMLIGTQAGQLASLQTVAADFHGNCDTCSYDNNTILGGLESGGNHISITYNRIKSGTGYGFAPQCFLISEAKGVDFTFENNYCDVNGSTATSSYGFIDTGASGSGIDSNTTEGGTLKIRKNEIHYTLTDNGVVQNPGLMIVYNDGSTASPLNADLRENRFIREGVGSGMTTYGAEVRAPSGNNWDEVDLSGNRGNVGWAVSEAKNVLANDYQTDTSGAGFNTDADGLQINSPSGYVDVSNFQGLGGNRYALAIFGNGTADILINGAYIKGANYGNNAILVNNGPSVGTGSAVSLFNYMIPGGSVSIGTLNSRLTIGPGYATSYALTTSVINSYTPFIPPTGLTGTPSGSLYNNGGTPGIAP